MFLRTVGLIVALVGAIERINCTLFVIVVSSFTILGFLFALVRFFVVVISCLFVIVSTSFAILCS